MEEIQQHILIDNIVWIGGLLAPLIAGALTVILARRPGADRVQACFIGAVVTFAVGAAGSYGAGGAVMGAVFLAGNFPFELIMQAWHRMWYPLGMGLLIGVGLALFALLPKRSTASGGAALRDN